MDGIFDYIFFLANTRSFLGYFSFKDAQSTEKLIEVSIFVVGGEFDGTVGVLVADESRITKSFRSRLQL